MTLFLSRHLNSPSARNVHHPACAAYYQKAHFAAGAVSAGAYGLTNKNHSRHAPAHTTDRWQNKTTRIAMILLMCKNIFNVFLSNTKYILLFVYADYLLIYIFNITLILKIDSICTFTARNIKLEAVSIETTRKILTIHNICINILCLPVKE